MPYIHTIEHVFIMKVPFLGMILQDFQALAMKWDAPPFVAWNIARWIYRRGVIDFTEMDDVSLEIRNKLIENFIPGNFSYSERKVSADGSVKYGFHTEDGRRFETVYLPEGRRHTLCLSIQAGCRMGCKFCRTARSGFHGNLEVHHILNQLYSIEEKKLINHIVFMGMGEPMDNYENLLRSIDVLTSEWGFAIAYRNITVSTVGINPGLIHFLQNNRCNLALSLHSPFEKERMKLIPAEKVYPFRELLSHMKDYEPARKRRITVQYTLIGGLNDSDRHLLELINLLKNSSLKLNLIAFHPFEGCEYRPADLQKMKHFLNDLNQAGIFATLRKSRGEDIGAACGMLGNSGEK
jgi:23S rRNA (adenine2503-C2)-methyltransferase